MIKKQGNPNSTEGGKEMKFTIIDSGAGYELHRAGCADLKKSEKLFADIRDTFKAESVDEFLGAYFDAYMRDLGYTPDMCRVFPCCHATGRS